MSAYILYTMDEQSKKTKEYPNKTAKEIISAIAKKWNELPSHQKKVRLNSRLNNIHIINEVISMRYET